MTSPDSRTSTVTGPWRYVPSLYTVALIAMLGAVLIVALYPRLDTDFWWHLKDGQHIVDSRSVPSRDFMSFTLRGHVWTDHEWLAEVGMYALFQLAGLWGPIACFALLICATFALVYARMVLADVPRVTALFIMAAAFVASSASWGPRIQMATLFFLSLFLIVLDRFIATRDRRLLYVLPVGMVIWTNLHGGFVLGIVLIGVYVVGEWLQRRTGGEATLTVDELRALTLSGVATFAVTMLNPNGPRLLLYPLSYVLPNPYTNLIQESASPNFHTPIMMVFEALLLLLLASFVVGRPPLRWTRLLLVLVFAHLALSQVRNVAVWAVTVGPLVAVYLHQAYPAVREQLRSRTRERRQVQPRVAAILNITLLLCALLLYATEAAHYINAGSLHSAEADNYPSGAVAYLTRHSLPPRIFTSYNWGGYVLWHLSPRYADYMDSRADTLYTSRILQDYVQAYAAGPRWSTVLTGYRVQDVLVERAAPLAAVLAEDGRWRLAYHDRISVLYTLR